METALKFYIATASWLVQIIIAQDDLDDMSYGEPKLATQYEVSELSWVHGYQLGSLGYKCG